MFLKKEGKMLFKKYKMILHRMNKEDMIVVIELLTKLMEVLDFLTEKLGLFGTALTGIAIYAFVKNFD